MFDKKNVLVTGAAGLAGNESVKQLLDRGAYVRATIYNDPASKHRSIQRAHNAHKNLEVFPCDLMDFEQTRKAVRDMDIVVNCAAFICGAKGQSENPLRLIRKNLVPYVNLIENSCNEKVDKFAFIGSSTMYADSGDHRLKEDEAFINDPPSCYDGFGWMKRYCEKLCMQFHNMTSTNFSLIRTGAMYGPCASFDPEKCHVVPALIIKAHNKEDPFEVWGNGTQRRDFIYVSDLIEGLLLALEKHDCADPINIATGVGCSINDLLQIIVNQYNYSPQIQYSTSKPGMINSRILNPEKAEKILGWKSKISLEEGVTKTIDWYKSQRNNNV